jgi:hypothetical protein
MRATVSRVIAGGLLLACLPLWSPAPAIADDSPEKSLAGKFPSGAYAFAEADGLEPVVERIHHSEFLQRIVLSPQYSAIIESQQYQRGQAGVAILEGQLGTDVWTAFEKLLGGRWGVALYPGDTPRRPNLVALIETTDPEFLAVVRERLDPFLDLAGERVERFETDGGQQGFSLDGRLCVVIGEQSIFAATTRDLLARLQSADRGETASGTESLAGDERFVAMTRHLGDDHHLRVFVDSLAISQASGGRIAVPEKVGNPLASLLFSGLLRLAAGSPYFGITLDAGESGFNVVAGVQGNSRDLPDTHRVFFSDPDQPGTDPLPQVDGLIGGITLYRDIDGWYRQRENYLKPETLPGFDQFETNIGNLLPGRDIGEDVLPLLGDRITLLAALQTFDHLNGEPGIKLPGFAAVVELADPQKGADTLRLFFQTFTAVLNLQAGQQGREPWVMDSESYGDTQIAFARYLSTPEGDALPIVFNFQPTSAQVGNRFLICSSVDLCRSLIDASRRSETRAENRNFDLEVHADLVADALEMNRGLLEARAIQAGRDSERAGEEVTALLDAIRGLDALQVTTSAGEGTFELRLQGSWK